MTAMKLITFLAFSSWLIVLARLSDASSDNSVATVDSDFYKMKDRCTSIALGPKATADGSTITTHNDDCQECDIRLTHVPAYDWPEGSRRPIYDVRVAYPRYVEQDGDDILRTVGRETNIHGPDYVSSKVDRSIYNWSLSVPIGYIDQVSHTYAYTLGTYGLQNEKQVSIGESTCSAKFVGAPVSAVDKNGRRGNASLHMETLTEIALERCATARCAIQTMGDLALKYGFYGPAWDEDLVTAQDEAGEALSISDPFEAWMFHILPDDTGSSAIWVAQRVPDDHITAVANQFVIGEIDVSDSENFLASSNIFDIAIKHGFFAPDYSSAKPMSKFHFSKVYGNDRHISGFACTRRVWRVFTLAAPSLNSIFSPYTDGLGTFGFGEDGLQPYPFSVKVDKPLTLTDIFRINRDQYEGTPFDMTTGLDAGPYGDPMRFPPMTKWRDPVQGVTYDAYMHGLGFQRPISLWRTTYSSITQARSNLPDVIGAVTWIAQYAPHHSSFVPIYTAAKKTPSSLNTGTQYKLDKKSNFWIHCLASNYLSRWYRYTITEVVILQKKIETAVFAKQRKAEEAALSALDAVSPPSSMPATTATTASTILALSGDIKQEGQVKKAAPLVQHHNVALRKGADLASMEASAEDALLSSIVAGAEVLAAESASTQVSASRRQLQENSKNKLHAASILQEFHEATATSVRDQWWDFFFVAAGMFRDMYKVVDTHTENFNIAYRYLTVPRSWFESVGYWGAPGTASSDESNGPVPILPINVPTLDSKEAYAQQYPKGYNVPYPPPGANVAAQSYSSSPSAVPAPSPAPTAYKKTENSGTSGEGSSSYNSTTVFGVGLIAGAVGLVAGIFLSQLFRSRSNSYLPIN